MRMLAEALGAMQTWLDADEALKPWQVILRRCAVHRRVAQSSTATSSGIQC